MELEAFLTNPPEEGKWLSEKIVSGQTMALADIEKHVKILLKSNVTHFSILIGFDYARYNIVPTEMIKTPKKENHFLIDGKMVHVLNDLKTDFMELPEIIKRINKWLDLWPIRNKYQWEPVIIHYMETKQMFVWCNGRNRSVPNPIIELYENGLTEEQKKKENLAV